MTQIFAVGAGADERIDDRWRTAALY